ncbi:hypothetical protein GCM10027030_02180 [Luteococcus sediminum]
MGRWNRQLRVGPALQPLLGILCCHALALRHARWAGGENQDFDLSGKEQIVQSGEGGVCKPVGFPGPVHQQRWLLV